MAVVRQNYGSSVVEFKPHPHVFFYPHYSNLNLNLNLNLTSVPCQRDALLLIESRYRNPNQLMGHEPFI